MTMVVRCSCGAELRGNDDDELIERVKAHALEAHDLVLTDDQIRDMMEVES